MFFPFPFLYDFCQADICDPRRPLLIAFRSLAGGFDDSGKKKKPAVLRLSSVKQQVISD